MAVALALWRASHPGPTVVVTLIAGGLAWASGRQPWQTVTILVAVVCGQLSVGWSNDAVDAARDIQSRRDDKPVASGAIGRRVVFGAAVVAVVASVPLSLLIGPRGLWHLLAIGAAWMYNHPLKKTAASVVPFAFSFGALVAYAAAEPTVPLIVAGGCLGAAAHFANVLPDLSDDAASGVHGLPHRLGAKGSQIVGAVLLCAAAGLAAVEMSAATAVTVAVLAVGFGIAVVVARPSRTVFRIVMACALVDVVALLFAVGS